MAEPVQDTSTAEEVSADLLKELLELKKKKLRGKFGGADLEASIERIKARGTLAGSEVTAEIDRKKDWQINANRKLFGGDAHFSAKSSDGKHSYLFRFEKKF